MNAADDYDMGELFNARKRASQDKRASNRENSTGMLTDKKIPFVTHNLGVHLIVAGKWDFWPGTGKFKERHGIAGKSLRAGRGVRHLIRFIEEDAKCTTSQH